MTPAFIKSPARSLPLWQTALLAFGSMCGQDLLGTGMVVMEAHYNALMAGAFDVVGWLFGLVCSVLAIASVVTNGWKTKRSLIIIASVSAANFGGTFAGVAISQALLYHHH